MSGAVLTPRRKRLLLLLAAGALLVVAGYFVNRAFQSNLMFYLTPAEIAAGGPRTKGTLRVGGMVQAGSMQRAAAGSLDVRFTLVDGDSTVPVTFHGVLPDLFAEGKGAIAQGKLDDNGTLKATEVLAKHDENYMPPKAHPPKPGAAQ
jgi:cytochrome c-type biogenesis protein CcmE